MLSFLLNKPQDSTLRVLCFGAHSDDIEIGCGGTILRLIGEYPDIEITWIVFGAHDERALEAEASAEAILKQVKVKRVMIKRFRDGFFPYIGGEIKDYFEQLKGELSPDLIFTHCRNDLHQDHRLINELTWNTYRDHLILEYEIPKYDSDLESPNLFVPLDMITYKTKIDRVLAHFPTQHGRNWFEEDLFLAIMRLRGMESQSPTKYAEAFYARKLIL